MLGASCICHSGSPLSTMCEYQAELWLDSCHSGKADLTGMLSWPHHSRAPLSMACTRDTRKRHPCAHRRGWTEYKVCEADPYKMHSWQHPSRACLSVGCERVVGWGRDAPVCDIPVHTGGRPLIIWLAGWKMLGSMLTPT